MDENTTLETTADDDWSDFAGYFGSLRNLDAEAFTIAIVLNHRRRSRRPQLRQQLQPNRIRQNLNVVHGAPSQSHRRLPSADAHRLRRQIP